jgi:hypothetical protein
MRCLTCRRILFAEPLMHRSSLAVFAFVAGAIGSTVEARPLPAAVVVAAPGWNHGGGRWVGGPYRPWGGPWRGYRGWGYGYPGYGYGLGLGVGYGAGWALAAGSPWYWGAPPVVYAAPAVVSYGVVVRPAPALEMPEDLTYVEQPQARTAQPESAPASRPRTGSWYYCTEPAGYHPYVAQCSRPWIAVNPSSVQPADAPRPAAPAP